MVLTVVGECESEEFVEKRKGRIQKRSQQEGIGEPQPSKVDLSSRHTHDAQRRVFTLETTGRG